MSRIACYRIGTLLARGSLALNEAERLQVESHRAGCSRCSADAAFDDSLARLAASSPPARRSNALDRAIAGALASKPDAAPRVRRWRLGFGVAALAATAAAGLAFAVWSGDGEQVSLSIQLDDSMLESGGDLRAGAAMTFAHTAVTATATSQYRWSPSRTRLELVSGSLHVEVTPGTGRAFTIVTPAFEVVVLGTVFDVDLEGVSVSRGAVSVRTRSGEILAARLEAGQSWSLAGDDAAGDETAGDETAGDETAGDETDGDDNAGDGEILELDDDPSTLTPRVEPASVWLKRAGKQIRGQRFARARASLRRALGANPTGRQRAEAHTLRADIALASGDVAGAIKRYREVARRFRRHPQGESSLFAAARLEARRGRAGDARVLLERYLDRYPRGRFVREVRRKLGALEPRR